MVQILKVNKNIATKNANTQTLDLDGSVLFRIKIVKAKDATASTDRRTMESLIVFCKKVLSFNVLFTYIIA